ncbi:MAG TPA: hypothetical protein PLN43_10375, partial [Anaerolineales bacterium]|nr:hypothetical protein [Anaerolineales bacterium]
ALSERRSVATIQGTEWLSGKSSYANQYDVVKNIQQCLYADMNCIHNLENLLTDEYSYILISTAGGQSPLGSDLNAQANAALVYSSTSVKVYRVK